MSRWRTRPQLTGGGGSSRRDRSQASRWCHDAGVLPDVSKEFR